LNAAFEKLEEESVHVGGRHSRVSKLLSCVVRG